MALTISNVWVVPLLAFAVTVVLALLLRTAFGRERMPGSAQLVHLLPGGEEDYGLLCAAAIAYDAASAEPIRSRLEAAGIRTTLVTGGDGQVRVLVFEDELDRARRVVG